MNDNIKWPEEINLPKETGIAGKALEKPPRANKHFRCKVDVVGQGFTASYIVPDTRLADLVSWLQNYGQRRRTVKRKGH